MNLGSVGPELTLTVVLSLNLHAFIMVILFSPFYRLENQGSGNVKKPSKINALAVL